MQVELSGIKTIRRELSISGVEMAIIQSVAKKLLKIISGAQTGADRAALDAALKLGIHCGGYVPKGRFAEDGKIPSKYPVTECPSSDYSVRTRLNAKESDATLILKLGELEGGTLYTFRLCKKLDKKVKVIDLDDRNVSKEIEKFARGILPGILNIAGPRESKSQGIYKKALKVLLKALNSL